MVRRQRSESGAINFVQVLLVAAVLGGGYFAWARGPMYLEFMDLKTGVRTGANKSYTSRHVETVREEVLKVVRENAMKTYGLGVDGAVMEYPLELKDENIQVEFTETPPSVTIRLDFDRAFVWPLTKKLGKVHYSYTHKEDLSAIKY